MFYICCIKIEVVFFDFDLVFTLLRLSVKINRYRHQYFKCIKYQFYVLHISDITLRLNNYFKLRTFKNGDSDEVLFLCLIFFLNYF